METPAGIFPNQPVISHPRDIFFLVEKAFKTVRLHIDIDHTNIEYYVIEAELSLKNLNF